MLFTYIYNEIHIIQSALYICAYKSWKTVIDIMHMYSLYQIFHSNPTVSYPYDISVSSHVVVADSVKHYHLYEYVTQDLINIMINNPFLEMIATNSNYHA